MQFIRKPHVAISALAVVFLLTACGNRKAKDETAKTEDYIAALALDTLPSDSLDAKYATQMLPAGSIIPELALPTPEGDTLRLSDFRGQWVVMDFWASWCPDCRKENPNVVAAYQKYHDQGFDILGVSFDTNKEAWLAAIEKDGLTWTHVSDLQGWSNAAGALYAIAFIPQNALIKDGMIVARNLEGEALLKEIERVLGE